MSGFTIEFTPWAQFHARKNQPVITSWLHRVGEASVEAFRGGMGNYPPASAPGAWPNSRTGNLRASINYEADMDSVTVGTNMPYSGYLRSGTSRMERRKMSDNALEEGIKQAGRLGHWVEWSRG